MGFVSFCVQDGIDGYAERDIPIPNKQGHQPSLGKARDDPAINFPSPRPSPLKTAICSAIANSWYAL